MFFNIFQFLKKVNAQKSAKLMIVLFIVGVSYLVSVGSAQAFTAPSGLTTSTITTTAITVNWTETGDAQTMFAFGKSTDGVTYTTTTLASAGTYAGATSTIFSSLAANTQYWFRIGAGDGTTTSTLGVMVGYTWTLTTTPTTPTVGTPTVSSLPLTLTDTGATTYSIDVVSSTFHEYLQANGTLSPTQVWLSYTALGTVANVTSTPGLMANTSYTIVLAGKNGAGTVASSTASGAVYTLTTTPTTPTVGTPTVSSLPLTLTDTGATTYSIKVASSTWNGYLQANGALGASQAWLSYAGTTVSNATTTTGLVANTSYTVTLAGKNGDGVVASSTPATAKYTATNIPSSFSATASAAGFALTWSGDGTKYYVENTTAGTNSGLISVASYSFTGSFICNQLYSFRVRGQDGNETNSDWSSSVSSLISCGGGTGGSVASPSSTTITPSTPSVTPVIPTVPVVPLVEQPVAPVATPSVETLSAAPTAEVQPISISNPESKVAISNIPAVSFQPGEKLQFTFQYQNDAAKKVTVKVVRQLINSAGKVVKSTTASKTLRVDAILKTDVNEPVAKTLVPGDYTVKVKVLDNKNKVLDENGFSITVEKLKQKMFVLGEIASNFSDIAFDEKTLAKVKSDAVLPVILKLKYSYTNSTEAKQIIKMTRQLLNSEGKVLDVKTGRWVMKVGETDSAAFTQPVAGNLSVGNYVIRVAALDWKTKEVLAENSVGFSVELK